MSELRPELQLRRARAHAEARRVLLRSDVQVRAGLQVPAVVQLPAQVSGPEEAARSFYQSSARGPFCMH